MLTIHKAKQTIDTELWNALKDSLIKDLKYYHENPSDPYDAYERHMRDLAHIWYYEKDSNKRNKVFMTELIKRYRNKGGRFVGEEQKPTPSPLKRVVYKLEGNRLVPTTEQVFKGVKNPPKQLDLFKDMGGKK